MNKFEKSNYNIREHMESDGIKRYYWGEMLGDEEGWFSSFATPQTTFYEEFHVDRKGNLVYLEIAPGITCPQEHRGKLYEYIGEVNATFKCGNIRMDPTGRLYFYIEHMLGDRALSIKMIEHMEYVSVAFLQRNFEKLQKVASGQYIESSFSSIKKSMERDKEIAGISEEILEELFSGDEDGVSIEDVISRIKMRIEELENIEEDSTGEMLEEFEVEESQDNIEHGSLSMEDYLEIVDDDYDDVV